MSGVAEGDVGGPTTYRPPDDERWGWAVLEVVYGVIFLAIAISAPIFLVDGQTDRGVTGLLIVVLQLGRAVWRWLRYAGRTGRLLPPGRQRPTALIVDETGVTLSRPPLRYEPGTVWSHLQWDDVARVVVLDRVVRRGERRPSKLLAVCFGVRGDPTRPGAVLLERATTDAAGLGRRNLALDQMVWMVGPHHLDLVLEAVEDLRARRPGLRIDDRRKRRHG